MPTFAPDLTETIRSLQRQIDQINTSRPGPMSWGARDGGIKFYGADGTTVLFQANSTGASVVSRGSLSSLTGLVDGIRDKNDAQDGVLSDHRGWIIGHGERLDGHDGDISRIDGVNAAQNGRLNDQHGWINSLGTRMGAVETTNDAQNGRLNDHHGWIGSLGDRMGSVESVNAGQNGRLDDQSDWIVGARNAANAAQSRADAAYSRAGTGISDAAAAHSRANDAYSRAGTAISNAAAAHARANDAYSLAEGRATQGQITSLVNQIADILVRLARLERA